jgi:hypothetical protein
VFAQINQFNPNQNNGGFYAEWEQQRTGPYATNGTLAAIIKRSSVADLEPDLFIFAIFRGYYPGYSADFAKYPNAQTWLVLKAHTNNRAGRVHLEHKFLYFYHNSIFQAYYPKNP